MTVRNIWLSGLLICTPLGVGGSNFCSSPTFHSLKDYIMSHGIAQLNSEFWCPGWLLGAWSVIKNTRVSTQCLTSPSIVWNLRISPKNFARSTWHVSAVLYCIHQKELLISICKISQKLRAYIWEREAHGGEPCNPRRIKCHLIPLVYSWDHSET